MSHGADIDSENIARLARRLAYVAEARGPLVLLSEIAKLGDDPHRALLAALGLDLADTDLTRRPRSGQAARRRKRIAEWRAQEALLAELAARRAAA